jgi:hypothetical protein
MNNNKPAGTVNAAGILQQLSSLLHLSLSEVKKRYSNYPCTQIDCSGKGLKEKLLEIRFEQDKITVTCVFDSEEKCIGIYLFPDKEEITVSIMLYLKEHFEYNDVCNRWTAPGYFIKIKRFDWLPNVLSVIIYG